MGNKPVWTAAHQRRARYGVDPRGPEVTETGDGPNPCNLQRDKQAEPQPTHRRVPWHEHENRQQPRGVQRDDQRVMAGAEFDGAAFLECACVACRVGELAQPQCRHQANDERYRAHASSTRKPAVNPGPSADSNNRPLAPALSVRSSTNNTVAADMLPQSRNTARA